MYLIPLYRLLDRNSAPPHAKIVMATLMNCTGTCKLTREAFLADRDMQALQQLGLITWEAEALLVTQKAYQLAEMDSATVVEFN